MKQDYNEASRGEMQAKDLVIDIDANFPRDKVLPKFGVQWCSLRPSFPPHLAEADACIGVLDKGIQDTHLH